MLEALNIQPGIYTESSDRTATGRWKDGSNVRFYKSNPEKVRGGVKQIATSFFGVCRAMLAWTTLTASRFAALGTSAKLYLSDMDAFYDITPFSSTGTLTNPFTTMNTLTTILMTHVAHGRSVGDHVYFSGATAVGGVLINGEYIVTVVPDANHYQFDSGIVATSGATGGGTVTFQYEIPVGQVDTILGQGWGVGGWGLGTWGTARTIAVVTIARVWSLVNWGEDLIASPVGAPMYVWVAGNGTNTRAVLITQAPAASRRVLVSPQLRIAISFGSHDGASPDAMLLRWCDSEDYTNWTPDITNLAGDKRLDNGSEIITAISTRTEIAIVTDSTVYGMTMTGDDLVFSFDDKGAISGLMGPNAAVDVNGTIYGMGLGSFWTYDGTVKELQCDVQTRVFGEADAPAVNYTQSAKVFADWNKRKSEVIFFFCSAGSTEIDSCVGVSTVDQTWWLGTVACTAFLSKHPFKDKFNVPLGCAVSPADGLNYLYMRETGLNEDGVAMPYFLESYDLEVGSISNALSGSYRGQGENTWKWTRLFPDFVRLAGNHYAVLKSRRFPNGKQRVTGPVRFGEKVRHIDRHIKGRQIAFRIYSNQLDTDISVGGWRADAEILGDR